MARALLSPPRMLAIWALAQLGAQDGLVSEHDLKAAFLYNFARHVEWPADAFAGPDAPFVLTVLGNGPAAEAAERVLRGKTVQGRALTLRRAEGVDTLPGSHLVFVPEAEKERTAAALARLAGTRALTVGEAPGFLRAGGAVSFFLEDRRLRFEISLGGARRAGLTVSSKLLRIARVIKGDE